MIIGIGTDILRIERIRAACADPEDPFLIRTFTEAERIAAAERPLPLYFYATRFAGKEAIFKAFRISPEGADLSEIEIRNDEQGAPYVTFTGTLGRLVRERELIVHLSLSYETEEAVAFAVIESRERD